MPQVAKLIEKRLGRPLEPFDIWYNGFRPRGTYTEAQLDEIVAKKYPTAEAYKKDMPNLLVKLGFSKERAEYLANNIVVDPRVVPVMLWEPACVPPKPICARAWKKAG